MLLSFSRIPVLTMLLSVLSGCGDVVFESDPCEQKIGPNSIRFAAFQGSAWGQKACDEIPSLGPAALAVDLPDKSLRVMNTDMRLIRADSWSTAKDAELDSQGKLVYEDVAKTRPNGLIIFDHDFREPGYFVEIVTLTDAQSGSRHVVRFPFKVGIDTGIGGATVLLLIGASGLVVYGACVWMRRRQTAQAAIV